MTVWKKSVSYAESIAMTGNCFARQQQFMRLAGLAATKATTRKRNGWLRNCASWRAGPGRTSPPWRELRVITVELYHATPTCATSRYVNEIKSGSWLVSFAWRTLSMRTITGLFNGWRLAGARDLWSYALWDW